MNWVPAPDPSSVVTASRSRRHVVVGWLVALMLIAHICGAFLQLLTPNPLYWVAGIASWAAAFLLIADISTALRLQVGILLAVGLSLLVYATGITVSVDYQTLVTGNSGLLTMITAVGFLRLVAMPLTPVESDLPVGERAYLRTLLGTSVFGSVINISAPMIIADRIDRQKSIKRFTSQSITRVFSSCASWSPFFAGMAVVLTYIPSARLGWVMLAGLPFAMVGLTVVYAEARLRYPNQVRDFLGYPIRFTSLWVPSLLAITVVLGSKLFPRLSILTIIATGALLITAVVLFLREGSYGCAEKLREHVERGLPRIVNELVLFLAAGVLAVGIAALVDTGILVVPIERFDPGSAVLLLGMMVLIAAIGVHPIILISGFTPMLLTLDPDPELLALTYLFAWSLGTCASPLSGTHLVFQGRYGIPSWKAAIWNWPYVGYMYLFAAFWLHLVAGTDVAAGS